MTTPAAESIELRPKPVNILGYAGDTIAIKVSLDASMPGAVWKADIKKSRSDPEPTASFVISNVTDTEALLSLDATGMGGFKGEWDCQVSKNGSRRTVVQGKITFDPDVTT